jgi:NAD-dependent deacetylase
MSGITHDVNALVERIASLVKMAHKVVVLTGAGFSTPSGIPDFRSAGSGLWTRYLPMEVASLSTFRHAPEKFYQWLHPLASHMLSAQPNLAHTSLARLEQAGCVEAVITQNIDGLHSRAGSKNVLEVHGTLNTLSCGGCFHQFPSKGLIEPFLENGTIPLCPRCRYILKPDVILFEEQLPVSIWRKAEEASKTCDLMIIAGSSLEVLPSASLPVRALENGASLIMVNRTPTYIDVRADILLREDIASIFPRIAHHVLGE